MIPYWYHLSREKFKIVNYIRENKKLAKLRSLPKMKDILKKEEQPKIDNATLENVYNVTEKYLHIL